ncbi:hypothetical protein [Aurantibacter sp.]|uniref:hypothetical protein n=1 Tax=Aurantibacter sp. TaxID=2807103 RepID=UPI0032638230
MNNGPIPEIVTKKKSGTELFQFNNENLNISLTQFWSWNQSNLIENRTRGLLAEFIVKNALEIKSEYRVEYANFDLITTEGLKLQIISAAYIQSWTQQKLSEIKFGIAPTIGSKENSNFDGIKRRWADYYVFCVLNNKDQNTINPLDLSQWTFYVLKTEILNLFKQDQKTIGLNSLLELRPIKCDYLGLKKAIEPEEIRLH